MLLAAAYFFSTRSRGASKTAVAVLILMGCGLGYRSVAKEGWQGKNSTELFRGNSNFGLLQVLQDGNSSRRYYLNDYLTQNTYDTNEQKSISMFTYMLHGLAKAYTPRTEDVLCIGMGIGIVPMEFAREGARVDVAEINPAVVPVAEKFFGLEPARLRLHLTDGRYFLNQTTNRFDAVILDAFLGDSCPSHLMTREAFTSVRRVLKPDGVLVINTFAELEGRRDFFGASLFKTLTNVFPGVVIHANGSGGNTLYVASLKPRLKFIREPDYSRVHPSALNAVTGAFSSLREPDPAHGIVLTDDYNPVEFYDAYNREKVRRNLAESVREWQKE
jgi:spermidine synthase